MAAKYPLQSLLSVRYFREDAAKNAVRAAERCVAEAQEKLDTARLRLAEYQAWWPQEVDRRYESIMGTEKTLEQLDEFKAGLAALSDGELKFHEAVFEAENEMKQCVTRVEKAREVVAEARKEAAKIEAHREIWNEEAKKEAERVEDLEMEEFSGGLSKDSGED